MAFDIAQVKKAGFYLEVPVAVGRTEVLGPYQHEEQARDEIARRAVAEHGKIFWADPNAKPKPI